MTALADHIQALRMVDTHEHLWNDDDFVQCGPDVLHDLFGIYIGDDLLTAGAPFAHVVRLLDSGDPDLEGRWKGVEAAWQHCQFTGYGEAVRRHARLIYGIDELTTEAILAAQTCNAELRQPGERLRLLRDVARLDHVQIDDASYACVPDQSGPDYFLFDLTWEHMCNGQIEVAALYEHTQIDVSDLESLRAAQATLFARYGACAIAVKAQHAYTRTLAWTERTDAEAAAVLQRVLHGHEISLAERLILGDWNWARGVELAIEYNLPFKVHTGYLAGHDGYVDPDRTRPTHLAPLFARYPDARFVLMHTAYPYSDELLALAKHWSNVYLCMCWSWSIDPMNSVDFVRRMIHTVPVNKVFAFGGDCFFPTAAVAYAAQARDWLTRALQAEVDDALLTEAQAMHIATRLMRDNQYDCFDIEGTRRTIQAQLANTAHPEQENS